MSRFAPTHVACRGGTVLVRSAEPDDAAAVAAYIAAVSGESAFLTREPGELTGSVPQRRLMIKQVMDQRNGVMLLALAEGELVGMLDFHGGRARRMQHAGELGMSVSRSHWGRGIGGVMLDALIAWAPGAGISRIKLRVMANNERAIALYRARDFQLEGLLRREMRVEEAWVDVMQMALWLE